MQWRRQGLWAELNEARAECLKVREDVLALLRQKLEPGQEPEK